MRIDGSGLPLLLRVNEVCEALNCCRQHVYDLMTRGELKYVVEGKYRKIPRQNLLAYLQRNIHRTVRPVEEPAEAG